jgi:hypothetical protein
MKPFWIESGNQLRLAIVSRPREGDWLDDETILMKKAGIDVLVSMLQRNEEDEGSHLATIHSKRPGIVSADRPTG